MSKKFEANLENKTISVHGDNLNPHEIRDLIKNLQGHLRLFESLFGQHMADPIEILTESVRFHSDQLSFCLSWNAEKITIKVDDDLTIPEPNVVLTSDQLSRYYSTVSSMIEALDE